ncbi:MAG: hypothetical protein EBX40_05695 [Gammaproteobacteria bacterium]|nr:hypothetical protein [Gammaproteobacteria bacterium]
MHALPGNFWRVHLRVKKSIVNLKFGPRNHVYFVIFFMIFAGEKIKKMGSFGCEFCPKRALLKRIVFFLDRLVEVSSLDS